MNTPILSPRSRPASSQSVRLARTGLLVFPGARAVLPALVLSSAMSALAANIAGLGTGILGVNDALDADAGTPRFHVGGAANINDGNLGTRVDNWWGEGTTDLGQSISFVGILWPTLRFDQVQTLTLTLATFYDGGWFGMSGSSPGWGGTLTDADLVEPTVQVSSDAGTTWQDVPALSDYLTVLNGHGVGGGAQPNPSSVTATFTLTPPLAAINGIRIIGANGGTADGNGFLGVYELKVEAASPADTDGDGMPDDWERLVGLRVGVNDAAGDADADGLSNIDEFKAGTRPDQPDTDADGLSDGSEVHASLTNPLVADTDGDGLSDGAEVNTHHTNPKLTDTDADGLTDGAEVNTHHTKPLVRDSDADGFSDGLEVAQATDPVDPASYPSNAALIGTAILGVNDDIDADSGTAHNNAGGAANINDGNLNSRVDNWFGGAPTDQGQTVSFVGIVWLTPLPTKVKSVTLTLATFTDGGWFGLSGAGPGAGGTLDAGYLTAPTVQISTDRGVTWSTVPFTSDYLTALDGHGIGGGANPNPSTVTAEFVLDTPTPGVSGIRIIGENGGSAGADPNGFIGVFEMSVIAGIANDTDNDGMDDDWERQHGLVVGTNDAALDPDGDGLKNLQEFAANTDPQKADTDGDGLTDGAELGLYNTNPTRADTDDDGLTDGREINTVHCDPLLADTDGDGLADGSEVDRYHCDPSKPDTDGDRFNDGVEVTLGTDPASAASVPTNVAVLGQPILGTKTDVESGLQIPYANAGIVEFINDLDLTTRVDTYNGGEPSTASYVGILWDTPITDPVADLEIDLAIFFDGGWFGVNNLGPGSGGLLSAEYLTEPRVQITADHGNTWTTVSHVSDYLTAFDGQPLPAVDFGAPTTGHAAFALQPARANIDGIRLLGSEGGTASGGFLGVFELAVHVQRTPAALELGAVAIVNNLFHFEFDSRPGVTYTVQFKTSLANASWQTLTTVTGDGTRKQVTDTVVGPARFYRVVTP